MATARPAGGREFLSSGYTHDFYVRRVYGQTVGSHDKGVMHAVRRYRLGPATWPCAAHCSSV